MTPAGEKELAVVASLVSAAHEGQWPESMSYELESLFLRAPKRFAERKLGQILESLRKRVENKRPVRHEALYDALVAEEILAPITASDTALWGMIISSGLHMAEVEAVAKELQEIDQGNRFKGLLAAFHELEEIQGARPDQQAYCDKMAVKLWDQFQKEGRNGKYVSERMWIPSQFEQYVAPEHTHILLPKYLPLGKISALIGPPGAGKSRLTLSLAIHQILGWQWCGMEVCPTPLKWGLFGDENSAERMKGDLARMMKGLTQDQRDLLDSKLRIQSVDDYEEAIVNLDEPDALGRFEEDLRTYRFDVVSIDPMDNFTDEDLAKPAGMKAAIMMVFRTVRAIVPQAAILICHHARVGTPNIQRSTGNYDAMSYSLGGKALIGKARFVMNLIPGDKTDTGKLVLECAKCNDWKKFELRGLALNLETYHYEVDPEFDAEAWQADVDGTRKGAQCTVRDVVQCVQAGFRTTNEIAKALKGELGFSRATVCRRLKECRETGYLESTKLGTWMLGRKRLKDNEL